MQVSSKLQEEGAQIMHVDVGESNEVRRQDSNVRWMTATKKMMMLAMTFCVDFVVIIILSTMM